jgi:hypothetical protein
MGLLHSRNVRYITKVCGIFFLSDIQNDLFQNYNYNSNEQKMMKISHMDIQSNQPKNIHWHCISVTVNI